MAKDPTFAEEVRAWRKKRNWLQKEAAAHMGVSLDTYRGWENKHVIPHDCLSIREIRTKMQEVPI